MKVFRNIVFSAVILTHASCGYESENSSLSSDELIINGTVAEIHNPSSTIASGMSKKTLINGKRWKFETPAGANPRIEVETRSNSIPFKNGSYYSSKGTIKFSWEILSATQVSQLKAKGVSQIMVTVKGDFSGRAAAGYMAAEAMALIYTKKASSNLVRNFASPGTKSKRGDASLSVYSDYVSAMAMIDISELASLNKPLTASVSVLGHGELHLKKVMTSIHTM